MQELPPNFHSHQHGMGRQPFWLFLLPADSLLPLLRTPLGFSLVHPKQAITRTVLFVVLPVVFWWFYVAFTNAPMPEHAGHLWLIGFALVSLAASLAVFIRRALGLRRREDIHSEEAGYSWLCWYMPLPVWLCELFIVPGLVAAAGWGFAHSVSLELGYWLMLAAASLVRMAVWEQARMIRATLALRDARQQANALGTRLKQQETTGAGRGAASDGGEYAELGGDPDAVSFGRDTGAMTPERMTWFRKRGGVAIPRGPGEGRDYADVG